MSEKCDPNIGREILPSKFFKIIIHIHTVFIPLFIYNS
jgi:hypothetical protein